MRCLWNRVWFLLASLSFVLSLSLFVSSACCISAWHFAAVVDDGMGRGALDMAVVWLTEESEHAAVRLHLYGLCETHTDDGWDACLDAAAVACSLLCLSAARSLSSSGLVPPHPSPPPPIDAHRCVVVVQLQPSPHRSPWRGRGRHCSS